MTLRRFSLFIAAGLTLPVLLIAGVWLLRDPVLESWLLPALERRLAGQLGGQVQLGEAVLQPGRVEVGPVLLDGPGFRLRIRKVRARFTLGGLARARLSAVAVIGPRLTVDGGAIPRQPSGDKSTLPRHLPLTTERLALTDGRLRVAFAGQEIHLENFHLRYAAGAQPEFSLATSAGQADGLSVAASGDADWQNGPRLTLISLAVGDRQWLMSPLTLGLSPSGTEIRAALGIKDLDRSRAEALLAALDLAGYLPRNFDFLASDLRLDLRLRPAPALQVQVAQLDLSGPEWTLPLSGLDARFVGRPADWKFSLDLKLAGDSPLHLDAHGAGLNFAGRAGGRIREPGRLKARLLDDTPLPLTGDVEWEADFEWGNPDLELELAWRGLAPADSAGGTFDLTRWGGGLRLVGPVADLKGQGHLQFRKHRLLEFEGHAEEVSWRLKPTSLDLLTAIGSIGEELPLHGAVTGTGRLQPRAGKTWEGPFALKGERWEGGGMTLVKPNLQGTLGLGAGILRGKSLELTGQLTGAGLNIAKARLDGDLRWQDGRFEAGPVTLAATAAEYLSTDGIRGFSGGHADLEGRIEWEPEGRGTFRVTGRFGLAELLVGSYYGNFTDLPFDLEASGGWTERPARLDIQGLEVAGSPLVRLAAAGTWTEQSYEGQGEIALRRLEEGFPRYLQPLLAAYLPQTEGVDLGGDLKLALEGESGAAGWRLQGEVLPEALEMTAGGDSWSLSGLEGRIPFRLASAGDGKESTLSGRLACREMQAGPLSARDLELDLQARTNQLHILDSLDLDLAGGRLNLAELHIASGPRGFSAGGRAALRQVDLALLTGALKTTRLSGSLDAELGEIEYLDGDLLMEGGARLEVFGGLLRAKNLRVDDLFTDYRTLQGDLEVRGLDLAALTSTFAFGEINGILDGYLRDLRLFGTVPSAFVAEFETRDRGERNISVKALKNLTILSQGGASAALSRGIYQFIDFYRYQKIGIFCALRNDVFLLRGTAREGSERYLVYGGWLPPRIDILAPATSISFKTMLTRLERLDRTGKR